VADHEQEAQVAKRPQGDTNIAALVELLPIVPISLVA